MQVFPKEISRYEIGQDTVVIGRIPGTDVYVIEKQLGPEAKEGRETYYFNHIDSAIEKLEVERDKLVKIALKWAEDNGLKQIGYRFYSENLKEPITYLKILEN